MVVKKAGQMVVTMVGLKADMMAELMVDPKVASMVV